MTSVELNAASVAGEGVATRALAYLRRHRVTAIALISVIAVDAWLGQRAVLGPRVAVSTVVQRDFVRTVVASGHVEAPHRVTIGALVTGVVQRVPAAEGQVVGPGQTRGVHA